MIVNCIVCHSRECFGEGLQWAGCTLIALLGQEKRYEALDFCYHIVKVHEVDCKDEVVAGVVRFHRFVFANIFSNHAIQSLHAI